MENAQRYKVLTVIFALIAFAAVVSTATPAYVGRIAVDKNTGKMIEYQSGASMPLGTLTRNAVAAGYDLNAIDEHYATGEEVAAAFAATLPIPTPAPLDEVRALNVVSKTTEPTLTNLNERVTALENAMLAKG